MIINYCYRHNSHYTSTYDKYGILGTEIWLTIIGADLIHTMNMHTYLYNIWEHDGKYMQQGTTSNQFWWQYQQRRPFWRPDVNY